MIKEQVNPFIANRPIEVIALPKKYAIKESTDLSTPYEKLKDTHYIHDKQDKTCLFRYGKREMYEIMFGRLSDKSRSLFLYIVYALNKNEDYILLSAKKVQTEIGMSKRTLIEALKELKACCIIANKERSIYWVNPMYIFNGNRIDFYEEKDVSNILVKSIVK